MSNLNLNTHHCHPCDVDWPKFPVYTTCPKCQGATFVSCGDPLPQNDARSLADKWAKFHDYCAKRDNA